MAYTVLPKLKKNSVSTTIAAPGITAGDVTIPVTELAVFHDKDGTLITKGIVIGYDNATETYAEEITITGASGTSGSGNLTGATRGVNADGTIGAARAWDAGTNIAVMFSTGIYENIRENQIAIEANARELLTANTTYYVSTTGSDSTGDGSSGLPWATIQYAYDYIVKNLDVAGYTVTIQLADGTYTSGLTASSNWSGHGVITIKGNETTPTNCIISTTSTAFRFSASFVDRVNITGIQISSSSGHGVYMDGGGNVYINLVDFSTAGIYHIWTNNPNAYIMFGISYTISGNATSHFVASLGSVINAYGVSCTLNGDRSFTTFASADGCGKIDATTASFSHTGTITGKYYSAILNAIIRGSSTFPGDTAGTTATGGQAV